MVRKIFFLAVFLFYGADLCHAGSSAHFGIGDAMPAPRMLFPRTEEVSFPSEGDVVFKWSPHEAVSFEKSICALRIYKGCYKLESGLIYKAECDGRQRSIRIPADLFEDGETYTWVLRKEYVSKGRTLWNLQTFKVTKEKSNDQQRR